MAAPQDRDKKSSSELVERLTLAGHGVHTGRDGGYLVHWRGLSRYCKDLAELQAHADKVLAGKPTTGGGP